MSACICLLLLLSICGAAFPASSGLHPTAVLRTGTASGGSMRVAALRGGTRDEVDDSFDERVERGLGGGELSGTLHDSPASRDRPMRRGGEVNQDEDHPASAPRRLNFDSPEDVPARASGGFGGGCGRFLRRESSPDLVNSPLLHTPLPKGKHGLGGFRSRTCRDDFDDNDVGDQDAITAHMTDHAEHDGGDRVNRFAFSATSPIASLPAGRAGRFKMSRRLTTAPSFRRDFFDIREVGRGEHGSVYRCVRKMDLWPYAVKVLPKCIGARERESALQEIYALAAQGDNLHVVRYYNAWEEEDVIYIQMELCLGNLLHRWRDRGGALPVEDIALVLSHAAAGLRYMHAHGVVHNDVKPENMYISPTGLVKLGDFGLARDVSVGAGCDEEEDGDRRYLAPEVLDDGADMQAADMYSLGASALELALATRLPEAGPEYAALRTSCPRPPAGLPPQVGALISALMDPDPRRRPTAEQVLQDPCLLSLLPMGTSAWQIQREGGGGLGRGRVEALHSRLLQYEGEMASLLETVKDMQAQVDFWKKQANQT